MSLKRSSMKRGDTIIEVSLAFAIFSLVAIISVSMMNMGLSASERSLELATARNELNAQAEALRFIHSSYISELALPVCTSEILSAGESCQEYKGVWEDIAGSALDYQPTINYPLESCEEVYRNDGVGGSLLTQNHAFIINTRRLSSPHGARMVNGRNIVLRPGSGVFQAATLGARIIYTSNFVDEPTDQISELGLNEYVEVSKVEGIWVIPVSGPSNGREGPQYYDFYIETCWYGSGNAAPTSLDTVVRLYNPRGA